jgi:hypothetical protein
MAARYRNGYLVSGGVKRLFHAVALATGNELHPEINPHPEIDSRPRAGRSG